MDKPKTFLTMLALACALLVALLWFKTDQTQQLQGKVLSQTLTQSLDGHRRFLKISLTQGELIVQVDPKIECPEGSTVIIEQRQSLFNDVSTFHLVNCLATH